MLKCNLSKVESMKNQNQTSTAALSMANTVNKAAVREPQPFMSLGVIDPSHNSSSDTTRYIDTTQVPPSGTKTTTNINSNHKSSSSGIKIKSSKSVDKSKFARELENILSKELETRRDRETKMQHYTPRYGCC